MTRQIRQLTLAFIATFMLMALAGGYWAIIRGAALVERPDNPRRGLLERRFPRGTIYDRNGQVLAESIGAPGDYARRYPYPDLAPVLGYVSPFYGTAGVEAALDGTLHGDEGHDALTRAWGELIGAPPAGRAVRLTLDLRLQTAADAALGNRAGAIVVLDARTGEILALASHPTFDPNTLDEDWRTLIEDPRAPLLNRATFALYQPGGVLQPFILAAALQAQAAQMDSAAVNLSTPLNAGEVALTCRLDPGTEALPLVEALAFGCPQPFVKLGQALGARRLEQLFTDLRLLTAPRLDLPTTAVAERPDFTTGLEALSAGQGRLTITPLHIALAAAALARRGELPVPQITLAVQDTAGDWQTPTTLDHAVAALAPETAESVQHLLRNGHTAVAYTGQPQQTVAWFYGFAPLAEARYVVTVLLEAGDTEAVTEIGQSLLEAATHIAP